MKKCWPILCSAIVAASTWWHADAAGEAAKENPVLTFYCRQAGQTFRREGLAEQARRYSFTATSYRKQLGQKGQVGHVDTLVAEYYFTGATLDSQKVLRATSRKSYPLDFSAPNVFESDYHFAFFPNDTGGPLAIGFETDSAGDPRPTGLAVIGRYDYRLQRLYLFYAARPGYNRFSKAIYLSDHHGYTFPDSMIEVTAKAGIFDTDFYRTESAVSEVKVSGEHSGRR